MLKHCNSSSSKHSHKYPTGYNYLLVPIEESGTWIYLSLVQSATDIVLGVRQHANDDNLALVEAELK